MSQDRKRVKENFVFPTDDSSMANAFLQRCGERVAYVAELRRWRVFNRKYWVEDPNGSQIRNAIESFVRQLPTMHEEHIKVRNRYLGALKIGQVEQRCRDKQSVSIHDFDTDPNLVNLSNGILNVETREFSGHDPDLLLTNYIDVEYDPYVKSGEWNRWLGITFGRDDWIEALQTIMGYSVFIDGNPERLLVLLKGPTSTGKSTFIEAIDQILGSWSKTFNLTIFRSKQGESARPDIAAVLDARVIHTSEASDEWNLHADHIKRFVGGDTLTTRKLYGDMFEKLPSCTPIIGTNEIPQIKGADAALYRRFIAVPFTHPVNRGSVKTDLARVLAARCGPEILRWLLDGYWRYCKEGLESARKTFTVTTREAFNETNIYSQFISERTIRREDYFVSNQEIREAFSEWMISNGHSSLEIKAVELGRRLSGLGWEQKRYATTKGRIGRKLK